MQKVREYTLFFYSHPLVRYIFVGGSTFVFDYILLVGLHQSLGFGIALATTIAYWLAIVYNFILNRFWTFSLAEREDLHKHLMNYLVLLGFNYLFTVIFVSIVSQHIYFGAAKALAVMIQTTWTYYFYKNKIFVSKH